MINAPNYYNATNKAYEILIKQMRLELPTNIMSVIHHSNRNIILKTYAEMAARFSLSLDEYKDVAPSEYGFTLRQRDKFFIVYNEEKGYETNRFTISHEVGHIVLDHKEDDATARREANCFARNILCPCPVVKSLDVKKVDDYVNCFHISDIMAEICIDLYESDIYYIDKKMYGKMNDLLYTYMSGETLAMAYSY